MKWLAHIRRGSTTDRMWRSHRQNSGVLAGIVFRQTAPNGLFESEGELTADQVAIASGPRHGDVVLETVGLPAEPPPSPPSEAVVAARRQRRGA